MPTPLDKAVQSRNLFFAFAGVVGLASVWNMWGGDMFPAEKDPTGDPETWTESELRRWLRAELGGEFEDDKDRAGGKSEDEHEAISG